MKICVAITAKNVKTAKEEARKAMSLGADLIEHRIDFIKNIDGKKVEELLVDKNYPVILTNRMEGEGGRFEGDEASRTNLILAALNIPKFPPQYVDIELDASHPIRDNVISKTKSFGSKVIVSKHFVDYTPALDELLSYYEISVKAKADIVKIVTFANSEEDNETIYKLIEKTKGDIPIVALAMGEIGSETRINSIKLGAPWTYASLEEGKESASGQIPITKMKEMINWPLATKGIEAIDNIDYGLLENCPEGTLN